MNVGQRGELLRKILDSVRSQDYPYDPRAPKKVDWGAYDVAQANEIADMLEIIRVSVDAATERIEGRRLRPKRGRGQPPVPAADVAKVLLMQAYLGIPNRGAEGWARLFGPKLGLTREFSYKTIERGYDKREVNSILNEMFAITNLPIKDLEQVFSVDGSGSPTRSRQNYAATREAQRKTDGNRSSFTDGFPKGKHDFVYSVFVVGATFKLIAAWRNTTRHDIGETAFFEGLMWETKELHPGMTMMVGDGAYAGRPQCNIAGDLGVVPRFLPRRNATLRHLGSEAWIKMLMPLTRDPQKWLAEYYQREASENVNSVLKNDNPQPLRKRLDARRCTEDKLRGACYNLKRLCNLYYLSGLVSIPVIRAAAS